MTKVLPATVTEVDSSEVHSRDKVPRVKFSHRHVTLPRTSRLSLIISFPDKMKQIPHENLTDKIFQALKGTYENSHAELLGFEPSDEECEDGKIVYDCVFVTMPNELINKLVLTGIYTCTFYVGKSEDKQEIQVSNQKPGINELATTDREGNPRPCISNVVKIRSTLWRSRW